jgi:hypothetical protein
MASREDLALGQPVSVTDQQRRVHSGEIVKVARALVTIKYGPHLDRVAKFRIDTQYASEERMAYGHGLRFRTMEQVAQAARRDTALGTIKAHGFMPRVSGSQPVPLVKLEAVAEVLEKNWP